MRSHEEKMPWVLQTTGHCSVSSDGPGRSVEAGQDSDQDGRRDLQHRRQHVQWRGNRTGKAWKSCSMLWGLAVVGKSEGGHRGLSTSGILGALSVKPFR